MTSEVYAAILAAGSASRFGSTKQLAEIDGTTLVVRATTIANNVCADRTVVVAGHDAADVTEVLQGTQGFVVVNDGFAEGLGTSLARAVASVSHVASAVIVMLADQPGINAHHLENLIDAWNDGDYDIVTTTFADTQGPPVLFSSTCFDELRHLSGDAGGKHLFRDPRYRTETIVFEPAALDIDTEEDLESLRAARSNPTKSSRA